MKRLVFLLPLILLGCDEPRQPKMLCVEWDKDALHASEVYVTEAAKAKASVKLNLFMSCKKTQLVCPEPLELYEHKSSGSEIFLRCRMKK